jgi:hypothetical protein
MSEKSVVTVFRSPSKESAVDSSGAKWTRGRDGAEAREAGATPVPANAPVSDCAHSPQNLNCGKFSKPHRGHRFFSGSAQLPQNFIPGGFSVSQLAQRIEPNLARLRAQA